MRIHFERRCEYEGLLTDGTKADWILVLLSNKAARARYGAHLKLADMIWPDSQLR